VAVFGPSSSGGGSTVFGSSGTSAIGIDPILRATPPEEPGASPFGFLGNLYEGIVGLGKGVSALIGSGIHDVGQAAGDILPGTQEWGIINDTDPTSYRVDDLVKTMAGFTPEGFDPLDENSIIGDIVKRWGPLVPGGEAPQETLEMMYENPVPFALDVAALGSGAAKLAGISGRSSLKAAGALGEGSAYATQLAKLAGEVSPRTARAAATRAGLEALGEGNSLVSRVLPQVRMKYVAGKGLVPSSESYNPVIRAAVAPVRKYGLTQSLDDLRGIRDAAEAASGAMPGASEPVADVALWNSVIDAAEEAGMTRIETPKVAAYNAKRRSMKLFMDQKSQQYLRRDEATARAVDTINRYAEEDPTILDRHGIQAQDLDVELDGVDLDSRVMAANPELRALDPVRVPMGASALVDDLEVIRNADGTVTVRGWHGRPKDMGPLSLSDMRGDDLTFGGFHYGTRQAAEDRMLGEGLPFYDADGNIVPTAERMEASTFAPVEATGRFLGDDEPLSEVELLYITEGTEGAAMEAGRLAPEIFDALDPLDEEAVKNGLRESGLVREEVLSLPTGWREGTVQPISLARDELARRGYAGVLYTNESEDIGSISAMLFEPSATGKIRVAGAPSRPAYLDMDVTPEMVESIGPIGERFTAAIKEVDNYIDDLEARREMMEESGWDVDAEIEGAQLWRSDFEDAIRRRYAHQNTNMPDIDGEWRLKDEQRLEEWEELAPAFRSPVGTTPRRAMERAMRPLRMKHGLDFDWGAKDAVRDARRELRNAQTAAKKLVDRTTQKSNRAVKSAETAARQAERALGKARDPKFKAVKARTNAAAHRQALEAPHTAAQKISDAEAKAAERVAKAKADLVAAEARLEAGFSGGPGLAEVHQALRDAGRPTPVYFAHIDETALKASDWFVSKAKEGANIYARNPHDKLMRGVLLGEGKWLKDPIEVAKRRSARMIREQETYHLWDMVTREFGIEMSDPSQLPSGYKLVAPDMLFINHRTRTSLLDRLDKYLTDGLEGDSAMAKALKETLDENYDAVKALMEADEVKMYAVPESVLKNLDEAARWSPAFGGKNARLYMDTPMNVWRGLTLTASPRWVVNNVLGNTVFGLMQGVKVADVARIAYRKFETLFANWYRRRAGMPEKFGPRERSLAYDVHMLAQSENIGHGYIGSGTEHPTRLGAAAEDTAMGRAIMATQASKGAKVAKRWGDAMKSLNKTWEDSYREASFLAAAEKGQGLNAVQRTGRSFWKSKERIERIMRDGFSEGDGRMALDEMNHFFGNYGSMTPFERHVIRRWVFPFWGFYRHSSKLLLSFPVEYPGRAIILQGMANANAEMMEQYGPMPEWLESAIPLGPPGTDAFLTTRGANPFSGVAEGVEGVSQMLGPLPKTILEQSLGRDLFTGREFTDRDVVQPYGSDQQYRIIYDEQGNPIGSEPIEKVAPGMLQGLLGQIPQYDMLRDVIAGGRSYDTASVLDAIQQRFGDVGEATPIDPETGEPYSSMGLGSSLGKFGGLPISEYDLAAFQERLTEEQQAVLLEALRRQGAA
jgi:hypothetical protein